MYNSKSEAQRLLVRPFAARASRLVACDFRNDGILSINTMSVAA
jgi:hypothetical protein